MASSPCKQKAPVVHHGFEDEHLTLEQKTFFWSKFRVDGFFDGQYYTGNIFELANCSVLSKKIHDLYSSFAKSCFPERNQAIPEKFTRTYAMTDARPFITGAPRPIIKIANQASIESDMKEDISFYTETGLPSCDNVADTSCVCGDTLAATDDTYCETCWYYFTVRVKREQFLEEKTPQLSGSAAPLQTPKRRKRTALPTPESFLTPGTNHSTPYQPTYTPSLTSVETLPSPDMISLLTPPPSSSTSASTSTTSPKKRVRTALRRTNCKKCKRDFPINTKKNDGMHCTQCCRKAERSKEIMYHSPALESLPWMSGSAPPCQNGTTLKRKAEVVSVVEDGEAAPVSKKMRQDIVEETADLTVEDMRYYGYVPAWI